MIAGPTIAPGVRPAQRARRAGLRPLVVLGGLVVVACLAAMSVVVGTRDVAFPDILAALSGRVDTIGQAAVSLRIPRTVMAVLAGAALGLAGAVMQGVTRNPLADPGILGVNAGASLATVAAIAVLDISTPGAFIATAIAGAAVATVFVYGVGSAGPGGATPLKLTLAGAATAAVCAALVTGLVLSRGDIVGGVRSWQFGGVGGATFDRIAPVLPALAAGFLVSLFCARRLNTLALGDDLAAGLGENVALTRAVASAGGVLLCGATVAMCGPIGFVGLVVPHACRLVAGPDHRWLLPLATLGGAALLLAADIVGRVVARPAEISVAIVTALVGGPLFVAIVTRRRVREL